MVVVAAARERAAGTGKSVDRIDTVIGWPPQPTRVLGTQERLAYSTLARALPEYMILAQVPLARFLNVPRRNSYADWLRRVGNQCVRLRRLRHGGTGGRRGRSPAAAACGTRRQAPDPHRAHAEGRQDPAAGLDRQRAAILRRRGSNCCASENTVPAVATTTPAWRGTRGGTRGGIGARRDPPHPLERTRPRFDAGRDDRTAGTAGVDLVRRLRHHAVAAPETPSTGSPAARRQLSSACANSRALKVCRSSSFSPTPMK